MSKNKKPPSKGTIEDQIEEQDKNGGFRLPIQHSDILNQEHLCSVCKKVHRNPMCSPAL